jgi:hypothetical protein
MNFRFNQVSARDRYFPLPTIAALLVSLPTIAIAQIVPVTSPTVAFLTGTSESTTDDFSPWDEVPEFWFPPVSRQEDPLPPKQPDKGGTT